MSADIVDKLTGAVLAIEGTGLIDYVLVGKEAIVEIKRLRQTVKSQEGTIEYHRDEAFDAREKVDRLRAAMRGLDTEDEL